MSDANAANGTPAKTIRKDTRRTAEAARARHRENMLNLHRCGPGRDVVHGRGSRYGTLGMLISACRTYSVAVRSCVAPEVVWPSCWGPNRRLQSPQLKRPYSKPNTRRRSTVAFASRDRSGVQMCRGGSCSPERPWKIPNDYFRSTILRTAENPLAVIL